MRPHPRVSGLARTPHTLHTGLGQQGEARGTPRLPPSRGPDRCHHSWGPCTGNQGLRDGQAAEASEGPALLTRKWRGAGPVLGGQASPGPCSASSCCPPSRATDAGWGRVAMPETCPGSRRVPPWLQADSRQQTWGALSPCLPSLWPPGHKSSTFSGRGEKPADLRWRSTGLHVPRGCGQGAEVAPVVLGLGTYLHPTPRWVPPAPRPPCCSPSASQTPFPV